MEARHTATPWNTMPNKGPMAMPGTEHLHNVVSINGLVITTIAENVPFDDAVFIKRACNAHDDLVAALNIALQEGEGFGEYEQSYLPPEIRDKMRAALAKAGAAP